MGGFLCHHFEEELSQSGLCLWLRLESEYRGRNAEVICIPAPQVVDFISFSLRITVIPCPPLSQSLLQLQYTLNGEN